MSILTPKFSSFFVHYSQVYGSIYSSTSHDFMDGAETVCSFSGRSVMDESKNERIAKLLTELSYLARTMQKLEDKCGLYKGLYSWAFRRYYTLSHRLQNVVGWYAYHAILDTCNLESPRDLGKNVQ